MPPYNTLAIIKGGITLARRARSGIMDREHSRGRNPNHDIKCFMEPYVAISDVAHNHMSKIDVIEQTRSSR
jgi:hypothetical protein